MGTRVVMHSLKAAKYNNTRGTVVAPGFDESTGRVAVALDSPLTAMTEEELLLQDARKLANSAPQLATTKLFRLRNLRRPNAFEQALDTPTKKYPPVGYSSIAAAEVDGHKWDAKKGIWKKKEERKAWDELLSFLDQLKPETIMTMPDAQVRDALCRINRIDNKGLPGHETSRKDLIDATLRRAALMRRQARQMRRHGTDQGGNTIITAACVACGQTSASMAMCSRCQTVSYCSRACQKKHYKTHRAFCHAARKEGTAKARQDPSTWTQSKMIEWYTGVPNLAQGVMMMAWLFRDLRAMFQVTGGTNRRLAEVRIATKTVWSRDEYLSATWGTARLDRPDFDPDRMYYVYLAPDPKTTGACCARMRFPFPPEEMDAWSAEKRQELERGPMGISPDLIAPAEAELKCFRRGELPWQNK